QIVLPNEEHPHMRPFIHLIVILGLVTALSVPLLPVSAQAAGVACGINNPAFCDTFDAPAGTGNRSGQLNGTVWGASRTIGIEGNNFGQSLYNAWAPTQMQLCSGTQTVMAPNDIQICNGQMREAVNDQGSVSVLAMYPKQPFDFAGRTGIVTFDVSNDTLNNHSEWPEFWITDKPVPAPFSHFDDGNQPANAIGIRFAAAVGPNQGAQLGNCPNDN